MWSIFYCVIVAILFAFVHANSSSIRRVVEAAQFDAEANNSSTKIIGGQDAAKHEFPWLIRIQRKSGKRLLCGGAIIDRDLILTASHCIQNKKDAKSFEIVAGAHDMSKTEDTRQVRNIKRVNCHVNFTETTFQDDICILVLESNLTWTEAVNFIPLANESSLLPDQGTVSGWGYTVENEASSISTILQKVTLPIVSTSNCSQSYKGMIEITSSMLCAGRPGHDSCQGDSGSPFICISSSQTNVTFACGIVSFGAGCGRSYPGVYTRVDKYRQWISENSASAISFVPVITFFFSVLSSLVTLH